MNSDELKGKFEKVKGDIKERISGASKDRKGQLEGMADQAKGTIRETIGNAESEIDKARGRREEPEK